MFFIILANKALAVSVKFSNSANDVTVMYNYSLTLHCKFGELNRIGRLIGGIL